MIDDVVVGSVGKLGVHNWVADVEVRVRPDVAVPANAVATIGQTSLLGSMHVALDPPLGRATDRPAATGFDHRAESVVDVPVDRADPVVAVRRRQRGRTRADRRLHPQHRHGALGTRG